MDHAEPITGSVDVRVCFVGDSFVAGIGDPDHLGWAGRLAARTHHGGSALTSYVLGVRRETSAQVRRRWLAECTPRLPADCANGVVLSCGVNDTTLEDGRTRVPAAESVVNLRAVLEASPWPLLVVGPPAVDDEEQNERTAVLDGEFARVCGRAAVPYVPVLGVLRVDGMWRAEVAAGDGAHPGAAGYERMSALVAPVWTPWVHTLPRA